MPVSYGLRHIAYFLFAGASRFRRGQLLSRYCCCSDILFLKMLERSFQAFGRHLFDAATSVLIDGLLYRWYSERKRKVKVRDKISAFCDIMWVRIFDCFSFTYLFCFCRRSRGPLLASSHIFIAICRHAMLAFAFGYSFAAAPHSRPRPGIVDDDFLLRDFAIRRSRRRLHRRLLVSICIFISFI